MALLQHGSLGLARFVLAIALVVPAAVLSGCSDSTASAPSTDAVEPYLDAIAAARWDEAPTGQSAVQMRESRAAVFGVDGPARVLDVSTGHPRFSGVITPSGREYTVGASILIRDAEGTRTVAAVFTLDSDGEIVDAQGADK